MTAVARIGEAQRPLNIISLGAGVQSTTMALMAAHGEITPMPDCAIFADTQAEPQAVYDHLAWLMSPNVLPFPVHVVTAGNILDGFEAMSEGNRWASAPFFVEGNDGRAAPLRRQCTKEYKLEPIRKKVRELVGLKPRQRSPKQIIVRQLIGISLDEIQRVKPSRDAWVENVFPLIDAGMRRHDCLLWMQRHGYPEPPKSACFFCPYHDNAMWRDLRDNHPGDWQRAVDLDQQIAAGAKGTDTRAGTRPLYLHRSMKRLADVDLSTAEERGQGRMFGDECEGMCGV